MDDSTSYDSAPVSEPVAAPDLSAVPAVDTSTMPEMPVVDPALDPSAAASIDQAQVAEEWADWHGDIADQNALDASTYAQAAVQHAQEGWTDLAEYEMNMAGIYADSAQNEYGSESNYVGEAASDWAAVNDAYQAMPDPAAADAGYDATATTDASYDASALDTGYDASAAVDTSYDASATMDTSYDAGVE